MKLNNRILGNAMWIIGCRVGQAVLQLLITMFMARYLGPSNYGVINYAVSLVSFFLPLAKLGLDGILVHELVSDPDKEGKILGTAIIMSLVSSILCIAGIVGFVSVTTPGDKATLYVTSLYSIVLLMESVQLLQYWFQSNLMSKYTSVSMLFAYVVMSGYQLYLLMTEKSLYWFAIAKTLDVFIIDILLLSLYFNKGGQKLSFSKHTARALFSRSKYYIISSMMVTVFAQSDRIMLKMMVDDAATGIYSAAVTCATMAGFVFGAIIDSMRPGVLSNKYVDEEKYRENMTLLYSIVIYLSVFFSIVITVFSPLIIRIMYGAAYVDSVAPLRISIWATTFSYIGSVRNVWILAEEKQEYLWKINAFGAIANIVLNLMLIPHWGVCGASFATLATQFVTNVVVSFAVKELRGTSHLMIKSLYPQCVLKLLGKD